jgi:hypothetical protein
MLTSLDALVAMTGRDQQGIALSVLFCVVLYQLASAKLLDLRWFVWLPRKKEPLIYWTVLGIEVIALFVGIWIMFIAPISRT